MIKPITFSTAAAALAFAVAGCGSSTAPGVQLAPSSGPTAAAVTTASSSATTSASATRPDQQHAAPGSIEHQAKGCPAVRSRAEEARRQGSTTAHGPGREGRLDRHRPVRGRALQERQAVRRISGRRQRQADLAAAGRSHQGLAAGNPRNARRWSSRADHPGESWLRRGGQPPEDPPEFSARLRDRPAWGSKAPGATGWRRADLAVTAAGARAARYS